MNTITNDITRTLASFRTLPGFDWFVKILASLLLVLFALNALSAYAHTGRWVFLALLVGEAITVVIYLAARRPTQVDTSLSAGFITALATFYFMAFDLESGMPILPILGVTLQIAGLAWQIAAKLTLGRSFGMLPAARGLVTTGPYAYLRHPIYAAIIHFIWAGALDNFSWPVLAWAETVTAGAFTRMHIEEYLLKKKYPEYREYKKRVKKLIPFIY